jgi:hypothetical protein
VPLRNNWDCFCLVHADLEGICVIVGCGEPVVSGCLACTDSVHQCIKSHHQDKGQSHFPLRDRLQHARDAHPTSQSMNTRVLSQLTMVDNEEVFDVDPSRHVTDTDPPTSTLPTPAHKKFQAKFTYS